jgi:hypothetical protein
MYNLPKMMNFYCKDKDENGVYPTFPVNIDSNQDTAKTWATESRYRYDLKDSENYHLFSYPNNIFNEVNIESLDKRGNGGRAYQVIIEHAGNKFRVDLREDALMDVILNVGIESGGKLNGEFLFVIQGSQTTLVRKGSVAYEKSVEKSAEKELTIIDKTDLKKGHLYSSVSGEEKIFIGEYFVKEVAEKSGKIIESKPTKKLLFLSTTKDTIEFLTTSDKDIASKYYNFYVDIKKSHSYRIDKGKVVEVNDERLIKNLMVLAEKTKYKYLYGNTYYTSKYDLVDAKLAYQMATLSLEKENSTTWVDGLDYFKKANLNSKRNRY